MIQTSAGFPVAALEGGVEAFADNSGLHLRRRESVWPEAAWRHRAWLRAALQSAELVARGHAGRAGAGWLLPGSQIDAALSAGFTLPVLWSRWNEYRLRLWGGIDPGGRLQVRADFLSGGRVVSVGRSGRYLRRDASDETFLVNANTASVLDVVEQIGTRPPGSAGERHQLLAWLRDAGEELGADLRGCLASGNGRAGSEEGWAEEEEGVEADAEGLSYSEFLRLPPALLEAAVAALYQHRGYRVALLPRGNGFGAAVLARKATAFEIAFVDIRETGPALADVLATESSVRAALGRNGLRSALYCRAELSRVSAEPLLRCGIEVNAGRLFAERLRSRGVSAAVARAWQEYRCRTFADSVRNLSEVTC